VKGIFAIFGHGNVLGLGQALEQDSGDMRVYQGRNEQGMAHAATGFARQPCAGRLSPAPPPSVRARPT
jgi:3D-(3,5/4)-trihydroxycyclohexane-1,2-dione acylhydrolase (decyclizing)